MTKKIKLLVGSALPMLGLLATASAHAQAVDAAFVTNVATTSIASVVTQFSAVLPVILPFAIGIGVLFAVIHFIRRRARPN